MTRRQVAITSKGGTSYYLQLHMCTIISVVNINTIFQCARRDDRPLVLYGSVTDWTYNVGR